MFFLILDQRIELPDSPFINAIFQPIIDTHNEVLPTVPPCNWTTSTSPTSQNNTDDPFNSSFKAFATAFYKNLNHTATINRTASLSVNVTLSDEKKSPATTMSGVYSEPSMLVSDIIISHITYPSVNINDGNTSSMTSITYDVTANNAPEYIPDISTIGDVTNVDLDIPTRPGNGTIMDAETSDTAVDTHITRVTNFQSVTPVREQFTFTSSEPNGEDYAGITSQGGTTGSQDGDASPSFSVGGDDNTVSPVEGYIGSTFSSVGYYVSAVSTIGEAGTTLPDVDYISSLPSLVDDNRTLSSVAIDVNTVSVVPYIFNNISSEEYDVTTVSSHNDDVSDVSSVEHDVSTASSSRDDVTIYSIFVDDVSTVSEVINDVSTVSGVSHDVSTVTEVSNDVSTVSGVSHDVSTVSGVSHDVSTVTEVSYDVSTVSEVSHDVSTASEVSHDVSTVWGVSYDISTASEVNYEVSTVSKFSYDVSTVSSIERDVRTVSAGDNMLSSHSAGSEDVRSVSPFQRDMTADIGSSSGAANETEIPHPRTSRSTPPEDYVTFNYSSVEDLSATTSRTDVTEATTSTPTITTTTTTSRYNRTWLLAMFEKMLNSSLEAAEHYVS